MAGRVSILPNFVPKFQGDHVTVEIKLVIYLFLCTYSCIIIIMHYIFVIKQVKFKEVK